jgi:hypothetical protein
MGLEGQDWAKTSALMAVPSKSNDKAVASERLVKPRPRFILFFCNILSPFD